MSFRYRELIVEEAKQDIAGAMFYYGSKSQGLDLKFFEELFRRFIESCSILLYSGKHLKNSGKLLFESSRISSCMRLKMIK